MTDLFASELQKTMPYLRNCAKGMCRRYPDEEVEDLIQDTLEKAWRNRHLFVPGTDIRAWAAALMRNIFISHLRPRTYRNARITLLKEIFLEESPLQESHVIADRVRRVLAALPEKHRRTLVLVFGLGYSYEEAAKTLNIGVGTVKSRVYNARKLFLHILETHSVPRTQLLN